jgi:CheY-like chemotaxis protein
VTIQIMQPDCGVVVLGDPTRLRQIVWHLLANAIKFTPKGGAIQVAVEIVREEARLVVRDSGSGIDPQFLPRIFERFTQADGSPTRTTGGLGVGLALVRELVELQGGEIEAENAPPPGGAVFRLRFPVQPSDLLSRREASQPPLVPAAPLDGIRVLVIDQDVEGREVLRRLLQQRGAAVRTVPSVAEALELLEGWRPDVLVSDTMSPQHDSYALVGKVHSLEADRGGRIPALALTTFARTDERLAPLLADVHRDLPKPIEPSVLTAEIARLTGRERRRAQR